MGIQWGTEVRSNMKFWIEKDIRALKDIAKANGSGWRSFAEQPSLRRSKVAPHLYTRLVNNIPWARSPPPRTYTLGQWIVPKEEDGTICTIFHIIRTEPLEAKTYYRANTECLQPLEHHNLLPAGNYGEVRIIRCGGPKWMVMDYNTFEDTDEDL